MKNTIDSIYFLILKKLESIEKHILKEDKKLKIYLRKNPKTFEVVDFITSRLNSTKTSFEILRDEIEELHQLTITLLKNKKSIN